MKTHLFLLVIASFITLFGVSRTIEKETIEPTQAMTIFTAEKWGCINDMELMENVTDKIIKCDQIFTTVKEIKNPEDVNDRNELYIFFPLEEINKLEGLLVVLLGCLPNPAKEKAFLSVDAVKLSKADSGTWELILNISGQGHFYIKSLYARKPSFMKGWSICNEGEEPFERNFFEAHFLEGEWKGMENVTLKSSWQKLRLEINPFSLEIAKSVDLCEKVFEQFDKLFTVNGQHLFWDFEKLDHEVFLDIIQSVKENYKNNFNVLLRTDNKVIEWYGSDDFIPQFRQKIVLKNYLNKTTNAEFWIYSIR